MKTSLDANTQKKKLLDQFREVHLTKYYSYRTEQTRTEKEKKIALLYCLKR